uniref:Uncharacterized protein n=1 Tax=Brassica oleracea var. oleracea TaxID=109376 RepID=A0A0D2ZRJ8_BRAOL
MGYSSTNIHFDYDGHHAKSEDDYEWIPSDGRLYAISFKKSSLDDITYSFLKWRMCRKMSIYKCTKSMKLSYIPLVENVVNGEADEGGIGIDNRDSVNNEGDMDNSMGIGAISDYVELPHVAKEFPVVSEWEDGLGFEKFQEFTSKVAVKDLIDRGSQHKSFEISIVISDATVHSDYPGLFDTPTPKTLVGLVQRRLGVEVSYVTVWRGEKQDVEDICGSPEEGYKKVSSYLYMLEKVNPDSKTSLLLDEEKRFKYLFVALGASIEGFQYMRNKNIQENHASEKPQSSG